MQVKNRLLHDLATIWSINRQNALLPIGSGLFSGRWGAGHPVPNRSQAKFARFARRERRFFRLLARAGLVVISVVRELPPERLSWSCRRSLETLGLGGCAPKTKRPPGEDPVGVIRVTDNWEEECCQS